MSKDQVSERSDLACIPVIMAKEQSTVPEAAVVIVTDDDDADGDDDDDEEEKTASMQFATERIVKYFSRCIFTSTGEIVYLSISVE